MPSIERADPDSEGEVEQGLTRLKGERFRGNLADAQEAGRDFGGGVRLGQGDTLRRTVDNKDVPARCDAFADRLRRGAGRSANLENPHPGLQGKSVDDGGESRGESSHLPTVAGCGRPRTGLALLPRIMPPMIHLRLVTPPERAGAVLDFLNQTPSVIDLIHLRGAAHKPDGDVILCDVAREDASRVLTELRAMELHHDGTIAIEYVDTSISDAARGAQAVAPGAVGDAVVWETVRAKTFEDAEFSFTFLAFMVLATAIAAMGILTDSIVLVIGGMLVGPEFGPLAGISVAMTERRWSLVARSAQALIIGFPTGISAAWALVLILAAVGVAPDEMPNGRDATLFISHPDTYSVLVALAAGIAGTLSLTTIKSSVLIGVLISVTTIPAAANIAVASAYGDWGEWRGAQLQLVVNLAAIVVAGVATLLVQRWAYQRRALRRSRSARAKG